MKRFPAILFLFILVISINNKVFASDEEPEMYRWVDKDGVTHFTKEKPKKSQMGEQKEVKPDAEYINRKEEYQQKRKAKEIEISRATNSTRRDQLKRELLVIDYNWYKDTDPEKAAEIKAQLGEPKVRVMEQKKEQSNMDKYKAFF